MTHFQTYVGAEGKSFDDMSFIFGRKKFTNFQKNYHLTKNHDIMYRFNQTMNTTSFTTRYYHLLKTGYNVDFLPHRAYLHHCHLLLLKTALS